MFTQAEGNWCWIQLLITLLTFSSSPLRGSAFWLSRSRAKDAKRPTVNGVAPLSLLVELLGAMAVGCSQCPLACSYICVPASGCSSPTALSNLGKYGEGKRQEGGSLHFTIKKNFSLEALCKWGWIKLFYTAFRIKKNPKHPSKMYAARRN